MILMLNDIEQEKLITLTKKFRKLQILDMITIKEGLFLTYLKT